MNRNHYPCLRAALVLLVFGLALSLRPSGAQPVTVTGGFKSAEYHPAPNETQMKSLLEGAGAQPQPDGRLLVTKAKYQTFATNNEVELDVEAPQCFYDQAGKTISSSGPLSMHIANGRFSIEGEGFLYQQTNLTLLVSNRVHTILRPGLFEPQTATTRANTPAEAAPGIDIFSDQFDYSQQ